MADEACPSIWHVRWGGDDPVRVLDQNNNLVATVAKRGDGGTLARASLIAAAPDLLETIHTILTVFRVIAEHGDERAALAAADMIPVLESVIDGANFLGEITPVVLTG